MALDFLYLPNGGGSGSGSQTAYPNEPNVAQNIGLSTSVGSNNLTIALKQSDGSTDPTVANPVYVGFRSSTATSGLYNVRSATAAASIVVPNGATLGLASAQAVYIYVYLLDNSGTLELAVSGSRIWDEAAVQSSTTIGAGSTSATTLYSTTGRSNVPVRFIGRLQITATAGAYASNATQVSVIDVSLKDIQQRSYIRLDGSTAYGGTNTTIFRYTTQTTGVGTADMTYADVAASGGTVTIVRAGMYQVAVKGNSSTLGAGLFACMNSNSCPAQTSALLLAYCDLFVAGYTNTITSPAVYMIPGDFIRAGCTGGTQGNVTLWVTKVAD